MNDAAFIGETIESVLKQAYPNVELHVQHSAAGTDDTADVVRGYGVRIVSEQDEDFADGANRGVKATSGELVVVLAGDDPMCPGSLEILASTVNEAPDAGFAFGDIEYITAQGAPYLLLQGRPFDLSLE